MAMGPNGRLIVSGSSDGSLILWDAFTDSLKTLQKVPSEISAVALSSDGKFILSAEADHGLKLWNTQTGKEGDISLNKFSLKFSTADRLSDGRLLSSAWGTTRVNIFYPRFNEDHC